MSAKPKINALTLQVEVSIDEFLEPFKQLPTDTTIEIIKEIDLLIADVGFTEELIKVLLKSLKGDLGEDFNINDYDPK